MKLKQAIIITSLPIGIIFLTNLPFLPGPEFLYAPSQFLYNSGLFLGIISIPIIPFAVIISIVRYFKQRNSYKLISHLIWLIPLTLSFSTIYIAGLSRDFCRSLAIGKAENLITEIENFKNINGYYPGTLSNLGSKSYHSGVIGIKDFYYTNTGTSYEVSFTQNVIFNFNFEIVTYNKDDKHFTRGESLVLHETGHDHWKYEIFD